MISKGYFYHFVRFQDSSSENPNLESMSVACEIPYVFPEDLPRVPLEREIDFGIELLPDTQPISIPPYRMAPGKTQRIKRTVEGSPREGIHQTQCIP